LDSLRPDIASVALLARHARRALNTLRSRGTGWTRDALDALRASLASRSSCTALARVALRAGYTGNALRSRWPRWANGPRHARHTLRAGSPDVASRTGYAGWTLRTSHAGHALRSLRTSQANLRPRCKIDSKLPELAVTQRQNQHPGFTPQLRDRVTLCDVGNAAVSTLAVPRLMRSVSVSRVERHDRREYVSAFDLRHETTRLTVPVIG
jgi:hypothetical protein